MTYRELVNAVLRRLRLDEIGFVTDSPYSRMIGDLVNQAKREVEDAHSWLALESVVSLSTVAAVSTYTLVGFGRRARIRSVHNTTTRADIRSLSFDRFQRRVDFAANTGAPTYWRINGLVGDDPVIELYPTPEAVYAVSVYATSPQSDLSDDSEELTVSPYPVILGGYALAVAERGDDRGAAEQMAQREYESALSDAVARDAFNNESGQASDWVVV